MKTIPVNKPTNLNIFKLMLGIFVIIFSKQLTNNGPKHNALTLELKKLLDCDFLTLFANGHLALETALELLESKGGEIITTPFTFASSTHAITRKGYTPVFSDIRRTDYTIDPSHVESLITDKTVAILPVHVYGNVCDVEELERISKEYNLPLIYDSAHAFGVQYKSKQISNYGDINMFSFHATKVFHTVEGGALTYNNLKFEEQLIAIKNFGIDYEGLVSYQGTNAKMNEFQALVGLANLKKFNKIIKKRKRICKLYDDQFDGTDGIEIYHKSKEIKSNYAYYPILILKDQKNPKGLLEYLKSKGILARRYFYPLTSDFPIYKESFDSSKTTVANFVVERVICLPLYTDLKLSEVKYITRIVKEYLML